MRMAHPKKMMVELKEVSCSDFIVLDSKQENLADHTFHTHLGIEYFLSAKNKFLWKITVTVKLIMTKRETGEKASINCTSTFIIETDWNFKKYLSHQITLLLFTELALTTNGFLTAFAIEKSKETVFQEMLNRYISYKEMMEIVEETISSQLN